MIVRSKMSKKNNYHHKTLFKVNLNSIIKLIWSRNQLLKLMIMLKLVIKRVLMEIHFFFLLVKRAKWKGKLKDSNVKKKVFLKSLKFLCCSPKRELKNFNGRKRQRLSKKWSFRLNVELLSNQVKYKLNSFQLISQH